MKCKAYIGTNRVNPFFSKSVTASSIVAIMFLFGSVLEVIEKLRLFVKRSVLIWINCLEDILITHFLLSVILVVFCVTLFLLINSLNFCMFLFLLIQKISYTSFYESFLKEGTPQVF